MTLLVALLLLVGGVGDRPSSAGPTERGEVRAISGRTPFPKGCNVAGERSPGSEVEPHVAINPRNSANVVAAWQQDRFVGGGALSNVVGASRNGGRSWRRVKVPGISRCTGGRFPRATDPWVSIGPDGAAYLASLSFGPEVTDCAAAPTEPSSRSLAPGLRSPEPPEALGQLPELEVLAPCGEILVSRSTDGGFSWRPPVVVAGTSDVLLDDKEMITADPRKRGHAYVVWAKFDPVGLTSSTFFSRTRDGGRTWSEQRLIHASPGNFEQGNLILVLPGGALLNVFVRIPYARLPHEQVGSPVPSVPFEVLATRSTDGGESWSAPVRVAEIPQVTVRDPETGQGIRTADFLPSAAVGSDGAAYVGWQDVNSTRSSRIMIARSTDGGAGWHVLRPVVRARTQAFMPSLAVTAGGVVGVTYYDFRRDKLCDCNQPNRTPLTTDVWFAHSHNGGRTWRERHLAGPFNMRSAPLAGGLLFLGDYQGLARTPGGFAAVFSQAKPRAKAGKADVFFADIRTPSAD